MLCSWRMAFLTAATTACSIAATTFSESFDTVSNLPGNGWAIINNSSPIGAKNWFQGNSGVFSSQTGPLDSYIAANFESANVLGGDTSTWLLTPVLTLVDGLILTFYTRTETGSNFADRLEVRASINGASSNVGATSTSVGDFNNLLRAINPTLLPSGYPDSWTLTTITLSGIGGPTSGRLAFRYFVPDTTVNGNYIGLDTLSIDSVTTPEPASFVLAAAGLAAFVIRRRRAIKTTQVGMAALALAAVPAFAQQKTPPTKVNPPAIKADATKKPAAKPSSQTGMVVVKDADTGALRAPTAQEFQQLMGAAPLTGSSAQAPRITSSPGGVPMMVLDDSTMVYSVVKKNADGTLSFGEAVGPKAAEKLVNSTTKKSAKEAADVQ